MKRKQKNKRKQHKKKQHQTYNDKPAHENQKFIETSEINQALVSRDYVLLREIGKEKGFKSDAIRRKVW